MSVIEGFGLVVDLDDADGDTAWLSVRGEVDISNVGALATALDLASSAYPRRLVVDIGGINFISSCAIRAIARAHHRMAGFTEVEVVGASPLIRRIFELTGAADLLTTSGGRRPA
jgi:anti-anti-sigma factor